ncbi:MAG: ABC transporter ATP-binding protein [Planctomycetota bacterium]
MVGPNLLSARGLTFAYPGREPVLRGVDLDLRAGEMVAVFGPNGAGKSTLLRVLAGLRQPDQGAVHAGSEALMSLPPRERARRIARMPQGLDHWPDTRVEDLVWGGRYCHIERRFWPGSPSGASTDAQAVTRAMQRTGCEPWRERSVRELSGGQRERVLLARALAQDAPVLLADEPTRSLDPAQQLPRRLPSLRGRAAGTRAVLVVTHDWNLAAQFVDRLIFLAQGQVLADGEPGQVLRPEVLEPVYGRALHFGSGLGVLPSCCPIVPRTD